MSQYSQYDWWNIKRCQRAFPITKDTRCVRCKSGDRLQRHHKDRDRSNNSPENIDIVCQKCQTADHIKAGDWGGQNQARAGA